MAIELGAAYISILPSTDKIAPGVKSAFKDVQKSVDIAGKSMGADLAGYIKSGLKDAESHANNSGKAIGKGISSGVKKGAQDSSKAIKGALKEGSSTAKTEGAQAGNTFSRSFTSGVGSLRKGLKSVFSGVESDSKATGKRIKDNLTPKAEKTRGGGGGSTGGVAAGATGGLVAKAGPYAAAAAGIILIGKSVVSSASDAQQSIGATETVFGKYSKSVIGDSKAAAKSVGLDANTYRENANLLGALLTNQGVSTDKLAGKTKDLIGVGSDLAATYGGTTTDAVEAISSAYKGEFDSLEKYGISITQDKINQEAMAVAHVKTAKEFNKLTTAQQTAAKQQATTNLITKQSAKTNGAFAKETDTLAHKQQVFGAQLSNLKSVLGSALLPAVTAVFGFLSEKALPAVIQLGGWLKDKLTPAANDLGGMFKDKVLPKLREFGGWFKEEILPRLIAFAGFIRDKVIPVVVDLGEWFAKRIIANLKIFGAWFQSDILPKLQQFAGFIQTNVIPVLAILGAFIVTKVIPAVKMIVDWFGNHVLPVILVVAGIIVGVLIKALEGIWTVIFTKVIPIFVWLVKVIVPIITTIAKVIWWLLTNVIIPVFTGIASFIAGVWTRLIYPIFQVIVWFIKNVVAPVFGWLWHNIIEPVFAGIGQAIGKIWRTAIRPVLSAVGGFIENNVVPAFKRGVDLLGTIWGGIKDAFVAPINFVIDVVYNNGIRKLINSLPGVTQLPPMGLIGHGNNNGTRGGGHQAKDAHFAMGGPVTGGTPGKDSVRAWLMPGEHVLTADEVKAAGGQSRIFALRKALLRGGLGKTFDPAFANGGTLSPDAIARAKKFAKDHEGDPYGWGAVGPSSFDCSGFMSALTNVLRGKNPFSRVGATGSFPWSGFVPGAGQFTIGSTKSYAGGVGHMAGTLDGMNVESRGGQGVVLGSAARGYKDSGFDTVAHLGSSDTGGIFSAITNVLKNLSSWVTELSDMGGFGGLISQVASKVVHDVADYAKSKATLGIFDNGGILQPGALAYNASSKPEAVFNHKQFAEYANASQAVGPQRLKVVIGKREFDAYFDDEFNGRYDDAQNYRR